MTTFHLDLFAARRLVGFRHWPQVPARGDYVCLHIGVDDVPYLVTQLIWGTGAASRGALPQHVHVMVELSVPDDVALTSGH